MIEFWKKLDHILSQEQPVFMAVVGENTPHSPGTVGARMLVTPDITFGTIGGGIMEHELVKRARRILAGGTFSPTLQELHHRATSTGEISGMICAGSQTNIYLVCQPDRDRETVAQIVQFIEKFRAGAVEIDPGGLRLEARPLDTVQPQMYMEKTGSHWQYVEQLINMRRVVVLGGGHCSLALSQVLQPLGYEITIFDDRKDITTFQENIYADHKYFIKDFQSAGSRIAFPELTRVIVMTTDYESDVRSLLGVVNHPFRFIGLMGSKAKITAIFKTLREAGVSEDFLEKITAPVGLSMRSNTPPKIAASIAAQLLQLDKA